MMRRGAIEVSPLFKTQKSDWHYLPFAQASGLLLFHLASKTAPDPQKR
jgi:hypothetical protein